MSIFSKLYSIVIGRGFTLPSSQMKNWKCTRDVKTSEMKSSEGASRLVKHALTKIMKINESRLFKLYWTISIFEIKQLNIAFTIMFHTDVRPTPVVLITTSHQFSINILYCAPCFPFSFKILHQWGPPPSQYLIFSLTWLVSNN